MSNEFFTPQSRNEAILQNICGANNVLPEPQSRIEKLLQAILYEDETLVDFTPESRAELLLYAILTHGEYDAEPQSRNETTLKAILTNGEYDALPQSRIEALLIEWLDETHYEEKTVSGDVVSISDAVDAFVADLTAAIVPVQSGSGDPSPTNIRPISGWTECKVYRSGADTSDPTIYIVTFGSAGTVYGWTLDVTTGTLTVDRAIAIFDGSNDEAWTAYPSFNGFSIEYRNMNKGMRQDGISNWLKKDTGTHGSFGMWLGVNNNLIYAIEVAGALETYDLASWKSYLSANPLQVVYPLATPIVYNLTPVEIRTLVGQNTIWADTGEVTVMYAADTKAFIDNYIAARRNG